MNLSAASISLGISAFKSQTIGALLASGPADNDFMSVLASQFETTDNAANALFSFGGTGISSTGRNMALFDPESAYRMMTDINQRDTHYKAQFSELSQMKSWLEEMEDAGLSLARMTLSSSAESIRSDMQQFVTQYNHWIERVDPGLRAGGLLADTQAAQISQYELEQSIKYMFNGANDGLYGLRDLGITIDANTRLASLDSAKLDSVLAGNKLGVVNTVREFSANFAKSADLLNAEDNFVPRQLDNLDRVIQYITDNKAALQAEFGTGDSATPAGKVAHALAAYNRNYAA